MHVPGVAQRRNARIAWFTSVISPVWVIVLFIVWASPRSPAATQTCSVLGQPHPSFAYGEPPLLHARCVRPDGHMPFDAMWTMPPPWTMEQYTHYRRLQGRNRQESYWIVDTCYKKLKNKIGTTFLVRLFILFVLSHIYRPFFRPQTGGWQRRIVVGKRRARRRTPMLLGIEVGEVCIVTGVTCLTIDN